MKFDIEHGGRKTLNINRDEAVELGYPEDVIDAAKVAAEGILQRDVIRDKIAKGAGDALSLLGTTSDAATVAVLVGACVMASLDEDTSYGAFRKKCTDYMKGISGDHDPTEIAKTFLASLAAGEVRLPALEKGIVPVLAEVTARGNAVAEAINPTVTSKA